MRQIIHLIFNGSDDTDWINQAGWPNNLLDEYPTVRSSSRGLVWPRRKLFGGALHPILRTSKGDYNDEGAESRTPQGDLRLKSPLNMPPLAGQYVDYRRLRAHMEYIRKVGGGSGAPS